MDVGKAGYDDTSTQRKTALTTHRKGRVSTCSSPPALNRLMPLARDVVHVCQQLVPGHCTRCLVRGVSVTRARALLRVCPELLAHIDADIVQFVLELNAVCHVLGDTCLADFRNAMHVHLLLNG